jgi:hypothetical protein
MSYSKQSNVSKQGSTKPFCKVCFDAGKSEREYTSHFVKSKPGNDGKVVCPYLLSLECSYCKKKDGHTARYCPKLQEKEKFLKAQEKKPIVDQDGWETKKGKAPAQQASAQKPVQAKPVQAKPVQAKPVQAAKQTTFAVLEGMMKKEEALEVAKEVKRVEYDTHFPGKQCIKPVAAKPSWGGGKPNWSVIAKQAPGPATFVPRKAQAPLRPIQEDDVYSDISEDDRAMPEPSSPGEKSWGWGGDWNDCPL